MPQPKKGARLGSNPSHQRLMLSNLALSLFENERIKTTEAKAKLLRPYAERLITKAKHGTVHHRRQVLSTIENREIVHKLFAEIAPRFADRNGGYTRIMKLGPRNGDGAEMALIELVDAGSQRGGAEVVDTSAEGEGRRRRLRRRKTETVSDLPQDKPTRSRAAEAAAAGGTAAGKTELDTGEVAEVGKEEEAEAASLDDDDAAGAEQAGAGETAEDPAAPPDDAPSAGGDAGAR